MAGSGKTTLMQRLNAHLHAQKKPGYVLNLDPAVTDTPYEPNIDIRDTVGAERERTLLAWSRTVLGAQWTSAGA